MSQQKQRKSATLRALRVKNVLMCQRALPAYVLTYQRALRAYVLTYQRALRIITYSNVLGVYVLTFQLPCVLMCQFTLSAYVLTCQLVLRAYVLTCQGALRAYVLTCQHGLRVTCSCANMTWVPCLTCLVWHHDHLPISFASSVSTFDATFFSFTAILVEVVHNIGKV